MAEENRGLTTIEVEDVELVDIKIENAFPYSGDYEDNHQHSHNKLTGSEQPDLHLITSVTGLRDELDMIEALQVNYSNHKGCADYYKWVDSAQYTEDTMPNRDGYFVSLVTKESIQLYNGTSEILGVTVKSAGFVGGQDTVTRDWQYGLVATTGVVQVCCDSTATWSYDENNNRLPLYVVANTNGVATKTDNDYGYRVIDRYTSNGVNYVLVSLDVSANIVSELVKDVKDINKTVNNIDSKYNSLSVSVSDAISMAQEAITMVSNGVTSDSIKETIDEAIGDYKETTDETIADMQESITGYDQIINDAKKASDEAVKTARDMTALLQDDIKTTIEEIGLLKEQVAPITDYRGTDGIGVAYYLKDMDDELKTKVNMTTYDNDLEDAYNVIERNAKQTRSMIITIDNYSLGPWSQAYGLSRNQASSIMEQGMIYIPSVDHNEIYQAKDDAEALTYSFSRLNCYIWNEEKIWWDEIVGAVWVEPTYQNGSNVTQYWVPTENVVVSETTYNANSLYKWEEDQWIEKTTLNSNVINRVSSIIKQTSNEINMGVSDVKGDVADLSIRITDNEAAVTSLTSHIVGEYITLDIWNEADKNTDKIYYVKEDSKYYYYKDNKWESSEKSYKAGLEGSMAVIEQKADNASASIAQVVESVGKDGEVTAASIVTAINNGDSSVVIDAEHVNISADNINLSGYVKITDLSGKKTTEIDGSNIITGTLSASQITTGTLDANKVTVTNLDASQITTGTLDANKINVEGLTAESIEVKDENGNIIFKADSNQTVAEIGGWDIIEDGIISTTEGVGIISSNKDKYLYSSLVKANEKSPIRFYAGAETSTELSVEAHYNNQNKRYEVSGSAPYPILGLSLVACIPTTGYSVPIDVLNGSLSYSSGSTQYSYYFTITDDYYAYDENIPSEENYYTLVFTYTYIDVSKSKCCVLEDGSLYAEAGEFHGKLYANSGSFKGEITAQTGTIGGLKIQSNGIFSEDGEFSFGNNNILTTQQLLAHETIKAGSITGRYSDSIGLFFESQSPDMETVTFGAKFETIADGSNNWFGNMKEPGSARVTLTISPALITTQTLGVVLSYVGNGYSTSETVYMTPTAGTTEISVIVPNRKQHGVGCVLTKVTAPNSIEQPKDTTSVQNIVCHGHFVPDSSTDYIGTSNEPWNRIYANEIWATTQYYKAGSVFTSDAKKKNTIKSMDDKYSTLFDSLHPVTFKLNDGTSGRTHMGLIAQELKQSMDTCEIDSQDLAAYCSWDDVDGNETYGIRYTEFISLCIYEIQKLKKQVAILEDEIKELKEKLK